MVKSSINLENLILSTKEEMKKQISSTHYFYSPHTEQFRFLIKNNTGLTFSLTELILTYLYEAENGFITLRRSLSSNKKTQGREIVNNMKPVQSKIQQRHEFDKTFWANNWSFDVAFMKQRGQTIAIFNPTQAWHPAWGTLSEDGNTFRIKFGEITLFGSVDAHTRDVIWWNNKGIWKKAPSSDNRISEYDAVYEKSFEKEFNSHAINSYEHIPNKLENQKNTKKLYKEEQKETIVSPLLSKKEKNINEIVEKDKNNKKIKQKEVLQEEDERKQKLQEENTQKQEQRPVKQEKKRTNILFRDICR